MAKAKIGDRVFIPELDQFGEVKQLDDDGNVVEIIINSSDGGTSVEVKGLEVVVLKLVSWLVRVLRKLFGTKK